MNPIESTPSGEIVKACLRKFPSASSNYLSRYLVKEYPGVFISQEVARSSVRYYRGAIGAKNRALMDATNYAPKISIPESEPESFGYYELSVSDFPAIVGGDAHIPYHDQDALEIFIERAVEMKAKTIILLGDWLDCYQLSRFNRDPRMRSVKEEIDCLKTILGIIRAACPKSRIVYKFGNHEERYDAYLMRCAPELFDLDSIHLENLIDADKLKIDIVKDKQVIKAGHLNLIHGHEYVYGMTNPVNPARGLYLRAKTSAVCEHFHQVSEHTESAIDGQVSACWSGGCLCGLHPQYMPLNRWGHGLTEIDMDDDMFSVKNRKIVNYRLV